MTVEEVGATDQTNIGARLAAGFERTAPALAASAVLKLAADREDWVDTGVFLEEGQEVTLLSEGVIWISREFDIQVRGNAALWYRIGNGSIAKSAGRTTTFSADRDGPLQLACRLAGHWLDETGRLDPDVPPMPMEGGLTVGIAAWEAGADDGLRQLAGSDDTALAQAELERLRASRPLPKGWDHLWRVGRTDIFCEAVTDGGRVLACDCTADSGIIKYPVDIDLDDSTTLSWEWMVRALPSEVPENTLITHDYLSIAVEFENGQDLTYFWSSTLPLETSFRCPIPGWEKRETHIVVRSGNEQIGSWVADRRGVLSDYVAAVGGEHPGRIVGVWIIALSPFQRRNGKAEYRKIALSSASRTVQVGP